MKVLEFVEEALISRLQGLPVDSMVAFSAACAGRLLPAYVESSRTTGRGSAVVFQKTLDRIWADVFGDRADDSELQAALDRVMALMPEEDSAGWALGQDVAEDAVAVLAYTLRCRQSGDPREAGWAARRAYEAVDAFVIRDQLIDTNLPGGEARVLGDRIVQAELERQDRDLTDLLGADDPSKAATIAKLHDRALQEASIPGLGQ